MPPWSKKAAIKRMNSNNRLQEILEIEPRLKAVLQEAADCQNQNGYDRIRKYSALRNSLYTLVGWKAEKPGIRSQEDYTLMIRTIDDLLPPDDVDLFPDGKPIS